MPSLLDTPITNSLLEQTRVETTKRVPKTFQKGFQQIVAAGIQLMFSDTTFKETAQYIRTIKDPAQIPMTVAHGIVKAISVIHRESQGKMPIEPAGLAANILMTRALDYIETVMKIPITKDILDQTIDLVSKGIIELLGQLSGLSPQDMADIKAGKGKEVMARAQANEAAQGQPPAGVNPGMPPAMPPTGLTPGMPPNTGVPPPMPMPPTGGM